jgi:hypothetical protein
MRELALSKVDIGETNEMLRDQVDGLDSIRRMHIQMSQEAEYSGGDYYHGYSIPRPNQHPWRSLWEESGYQLFPLPGICMAACRHLSLQAKAARFIFGCVPDVEIVRRVDEGQKREPAI